MRYEIALSRDSDYVQLTVEGDITRAQGRLQTRDVNRFGRNHGIRRFLVDATKARNIDSPADREGFVRDDIPDSRDLIRGARLAILIAPGDRSHDFLAGPSGDADKHLRLFTDRVEALRWLLDPDEPD